MWLAYKKIIPPPNWQHNPQLQDINGNTVAMILAKQKIIPPEQWYHIPNLQNNNKETVAIILSQNQIIPPKEWQHQPDISDCENYNVYTYLSHGSQPIPNEWCNNKIKQHNSQIFEAALHGQIPKTINFNPSTQNSQGWTVAMLLALNRIIPPKNFQHNPIIMNDYQDTVAMILAKNGIVPPAEWYHKPYLQNNKGYTVAMLLAQSGVVPQPPWEHDQSLTQNQNQTVFDLLVQNKIIPPQRWYYPCSYHGDNASTLAIKVAENGMIPPRLLYHDPYIKSKEGFTIAFILASQGIAPPIEWCHDKFMRITYDELERLLIKYSQNEQASKQFLTLNVYRNFFEVDKPVSYYKSLTFTIKNILDMQSIPVPDYWNYKVLDFYDNTQAMQQAINSQLPDYQSNDPTQTNIFSQTVAMILAQNGIIPPAIWHHNPAQRDNNQNTVAMILASKGINPPAEWQHLQQLQNINGDTVAMILAKQNIHIPKNWFHNIYLKNNQNQSLYTIIKPTKLQQYQKLISQLNQSNNKNEKANKKQEKQMKSNIIDQTLVFNQNNIGFQLTQIPIKEPVPLPLAPNTLPPSDHFQCPQLQNQQNKQTIAEYLSSQGIYPPNAYFYQDFNSQKVAENLAVQQKIPEEQWIVDPYKVGLTGIKSSLKFILGLQGYILINGQFQVPNPQVLVLNTDCQICLQEGRQEFIKTSCGHQICYPCFRQLILSNQFLTCPICKKVFWYEFENSQLKQRVFDDFKVIGADLICLINEKSEQIKQQQMLQRQLNNREQQMQLLQQLKNQEIQIDNQKLIDFLENCDDEQQKEIQQQILEMQSTMNGNQSISYNYHGPKKEQKNKENQVQQEQPQQEQQKQQEPESQILSDPVYQDSSDTNFVYLKCNNTTNKEYVDSTTNSRFEITSSEGEFQ